MRQFHYQTPWRIEKPLSSCDIHAILDLLQAKLAKQHENQALAACRIWNVSVENATECRVKSGRRWKNVASSGCETT